MPPGITDADFVVAQYDGEIAYMDACIQRLLTRVDELGLSDNTLVVINGDHGETLDEHDCYFDHHGMYECTLKVPLAMRLPGRLPEGVRVKGYNQHKDLTPTILELLDIETDIAFDGRSLIPMVEGKRHTHESEFYITECTWMRKHGWRTPEWKLIIALEPDFHFKPEVELYNLISGPGRNHESRRQRTRNGRPVGARANGSLYCQTRKRSGPYQSHVHKPQLARPQELRRPLQILRRCV